MCIRDSIETGLGSFQIRSRWRWIPEERIIEVYEIPYTTKTDVIIERIVKLSKDCLLYTSILALSVLPCCV